MSLYHLHNSLYFDRILLPCSHLHSCTHYLNWWHWDCIYRIHSCTRMHNLFPQGPFDILNRILHVCLEFFSPINRKFLLTCTIEGIIQTWSGRTDTSVSSYIRCQSAIFAIVIVENTNTRIRARTVSLRSIRTNIFRGAVIIADARCWITCHIARWR